MRPQGVVRATWATRLSILCIALALASSPCRADAEATALLLLDPGSAAGTRELLDEVRRAGGRVEHVVPGRALIGRFDATALAAIATLEGIREVHLEGSVPEIAADADPLEKGIVGAWRRMTAARTGDEGDGAGQIGPPLAGDAAPAPLGEEPRGKSLAPPPGAGFFDTSEFMLGSVTLAVLLPESDGSIDANQEDWTAAEEAAVTGEVMNGMAWWTARAADIGASLTFVYDFRYSIDQGTGTPAGASITWT